MDYVRGSKYSIRNKKYSEAEKERCPHSSRKHNKVTKCNLKSDKNKGEDQFCLVSDLLFILHCFYNIFQL